MNRWQHLKKALNIFGTGAPTVVQLGLPTLTSLNLPRTRINFAAEVGDGLSSSVLMSPIKWLQRTFPEAPLEVIQLGTNEDETVAHHPLVKLVRRPNSYYSGNALWSATIFSWIRGNAYWIKARNTKKGSNPFADVTSEVKELWYIPHWLMQPAWPKDGSVFISHYEYSVGNRKPIEVPIENVVHFRNGIDPRNPRLGLDLIEAEQREIVTDAEAASYTASLLRNMGIPGIVISPDTNLVNGAVEELSPEQQKAMKAEIMASTTGDRRGDPLIFMSPTKVQEFGFDPKQMDVSAIRNGNETRLCAALGIPSAVIGFSSGNETTKVGAAMQVYKRIAWEGCVIPMQTNFAETLTNSLLPEFEGSPDNFECWFNFRGVAAMQENEIEKARAVDIGVRGGWLPVWDGQKRMGVDVDDSQKIYLRPITTVEVPVGQTRPLPDPNAVQQTALPDIPKARFKAAADRRFLRVQSRLEGSLKSDIAALFAKESTLVLKSYQNSAKAAETKDWLDTVTGKVREEWVKLLTSAINNAIKSGWSLADAEIDDLVEFGFFEDAALDFAKNQAALKVVGIGETTVKDVRQVISKAVEEGLSTDKTARALRDLYEGFQTSRALTIARTETANAMSHGKHSAAEETAKETGLVLERVWSAVNDERTRESHAAADGQVRKMGEAFDVGGEALMYPGDPNGSAENVIACRCVEIFQESQNES